MLVYRRIEKENKVSPVLDSEIPVPVLQYLQEQTKRRDERYQQQQRESEVFSITILRNRIEFPVNFSL